MPQNMQKKPKVAQLELDEDVQVVDDTNYAELPDINVDEIADDDPRYLAALALLKHGNSIKKITNKLIEKEIVQSRPAAARLAMRVSKENPQEQRTNAYIQFGVAGFTTIIALLFIVPDILITGTVSLSPAYLFLIVSAWFAYKGYQTLQTVTSRR